MVFLAGQILTADDLNEAFGDSGVLTNLDVTPAAGWDILVNEHRIIGKIMHLRMQIQNNTGAAITAGSEADTNPGNVPETLMATINDVSKRPVMQNFPIGQGSVTSGCLEIFAADGRIRLSDLHTDSSLANGQTIEFATSYTIP